MAKSEFTTEEIKKEMEIIEKRLGIPISEQKFWWGNQWDAKAKAFLISQRQNGVKLRKLNTIRKR